MPQEKTSYTLPAILTLIVLVLLLIFGIWLLINGNPLAEPDTTPLQPSIVEVSPQTL